MFLKSFLCVLVAATIYSCASVNRTEDSKVASTDTSHCYGADIRNIALPVYPGKSGSAVFTYRFKYSDSGDNAKPVIVFLPGGPGYPSMDESQSSGIPTGYRYILTDQRGTGCNDLADSHLPSDSLTSENMAQDVVTIIEKLHLDNYIVYGHSFGTIHATKVVSKIEDLRRDIWHQRALVATDIQLPRSLVLEGTVGKAFMNGSGLQASSDEWEKVKGRLPADVVQQLSREPLPFSNLMPAGTAASNWGTYLRGMLNLGQFPASNGFGDLGYSLLALQQAGSNRANYNALGQRVIGSVDQGYFDVFLQVDCAELYDSFQGASALKDGKLISVGPDLCKGRNFNAYDSAKYYISTPTFYFQGEADPAAPLSQAKYHFKNHGAAARTFVQLAGIGHFPLQKKAISSCKQPIWDSISNGDGKLLETLRACPGVKSVTSSDVEVNATEMHLHWNWN